jgi:hypothetical protein
VVPSIVDGSGRAAECGVTVRDQPDGDMGKSEPVRSDGWPIGKALSLISACAVAVWAVRRVIKGEGDNLYAAIGLTIGLVLAFVILRRDRGVQKSSLKAVERSGPDQPVSADSK